MNTLRSTSERHALHTGGASCSAVSIPAPSSGSDTVRGRNRGAHGVHNFRDDLSNRSRLVFVDINRSGFAAAFEFFPSFHS